MGRPTKTEHDDKINVCHKVIDKKISKSTPKRNECTVEKVLALANRVLKCKGYKAISASTIKQPKTDEWKAIKKRIDDYRKGKSEIKKVAKKSYQKNNAELDRKCRAQNTKLLEYSMRIEQLESMVLEHGTRIKELVDQIQDYKDAYGS